MATRASLYLKDELQAAVNKRPGTVSEQLERLFACYKYCRRNLALRFTDEELWVLLYAFEEMKDWNEGPEDYYGLRTAVEIAFDDAADYAQGMTDFSEERNQELRDWSGTVDRQTLLDKLREMHPFDLLTLIDALEQALHNEKPRREIRFLLARDRPGEIA